LRLAAAVLIVGYCLGAGATLASPVVVVQSGDLLPYRTVTEAIAGEVDCTVQVVTIDKNKRNLDLTVREIWAARPEVLVALGARALDLCTHEFPALPVVFGLVADPEQYGGNSDMASGIRLIPSETQFVEAIRTVMPNVEGIAVLYDHREGVMQGDHFHNVPGELGIRVHHINLAESPDLGENLSLLRGRCQCMIVAPDPSLLSRKVFADLVLKSYKHNLPLIAYSSIFAEIGALMAIEGNSSLVGNQLGRMAEFLLEGGSPQDLGTQPPPNVTITLNVAVARSLRIDVPPGVMQSARLVGK
jgi:ABC-type uncharacterized transport system substrate-binding protein